MTKHFGLAFKTVPCTLSCQNYSGKQLIFHACRIEEGEIRTFDELMPQLKTLDLSMVRGFAKHFPPQKSEITMEVGG